MPSNLNIYFCGSIRGGRNDVELYARIIDRLGAYGKVLTPFVGDKNVTDSEEDALNDKEIHDQDLKLLAECNAVVAEVTQPSLGVGYELGQARAMSKKVLCLFRPQSGRLLSAMIRGAEEKGKFMTKDYKEEDLPKVLEDFFSECFVRTHKQSIDWTTYEPM